MSSDPNASVDREPETDLVAWILRLVAPKPSRRLRSHQVRAELRALVEPRWQDSAACAMIADPAAWHPDRGLIPVRQVGRVCAACPVNRSCLAVALLWDEDGIWAGTNPGQRTRGYRLLRRGVSAAAVVELLLTLPTRQRSARRRKPGVAATASGPGSEQLPGDGGSGGQEAA